MPLSPKVYGTAVLTVVRMDRFRRIGGFVAGIDSDRSKQI
jgi:hypothetical protein